MKEITTKELDQLRKKESDISIIDVREDFEVAEGIIPEAKHIPLGDVPDRLNEFDKEKTHYIVCRSGARSGKISEYLAEEGYDAFNVAGGMIDWIEETEKRI